MAEPGSTEAQEVEAQPSARRTLMTGGDPHTGRHTRRETRLTPVFEHDLPSNSDRAEADSVLGLVDCYWSGVRVITGGAHTGRHTRPETRVIPEVVGEAPVDSSYRSRDPLIRSDSRTEEQTKPETRPICEVVAKAPAVTERPVDSYWSRKRSKAKPLVLRSERPQATVPADSYWSKHFRTEEPTGVGR